MLTEICFTHRTLSTANVRVFFLTPMTTFQLSKQQLVSQTLSFIQIQHHISTRQKPRPTRLPLLVRGYSLQIPVTSPELPTILISFGLFPSFSLTVFQNESENLGKQFISYCWFIIEDTFQEQLNGRDAEVKAQGKKHRTSMASLVMLCSQHLDVFTNSGALQTPSFKVFLGGFIIQAWLIQSLVIGD